MEYQVLITSWALLSGAAATHSVVVEFPDRESALFAVDLVNTNIKRTLPVKGNTCQQAIALFK
jgi:hypothetical protein